MAVDRIDAARKIGGSNIAAAAEVDIDGAYQEAAFRLPGRTTFTFKTDADIEELVDEGRGKTYDDGAITNEIELTFLQQDAETKEMSWKDYRGKYLQLCIETSNRTINGKYQYLILPVCKVVHSFEDTQPGSEVKLMLRPQAVTGDVTVDLATYEAITDVGFQVTLAGNLVFGTGSTDYQYAQYHEQASA